MAGCSLIGGETAEMPGMYGEGEYDIAGFAVGVVDRKNIVDGSRIGPGDAVIGLASSGLHSNGYSLVRKLLLEEKGYPLQAEIAELGGRLGDVLLTPTRIYVKAVLEMMRRVDVKGMAHITGGGFVENIPRTLPANVNVRIDRGSWPVPPVFRLLQREGAISDGDMYRTFNMGIGMVIVVPAKEAEAAIGAAVEAGERAYRIGTVTEGKQIVTFGGAES
jgi:phosphoribosylformylglycinamidine cyclo-ligase